MNEKTDVRERIWTARGQMNSADKAVIRSIADKNRIAARIFITGEVHESYIGEAALRLLVNINDVYYEHKQGLVPLGLEPLFIETKEHTVRMARFNPRIVWGCFHPDILTKLIADEAARMGVDLDPWAMEHFDFYQSITAYMKTKTGDAVPVVKKPGTLDDFYNAVYLSCLILFGKPGYMDVQAAEHFAVPEAANFVKSAKFRELNRFEQKKLDGLREKYQNIQALTNPEMSFIVGLYEKEK
jgi:hypothetical protein